MPVFSIPEDKIIFPHPSQATKEGLLGIGGDLSTDRLLLAYQNGIFPWNNEGEEIHWWCLTPRLVLYPEKIIIHKSLRPLLKDARIKITFDLAFEEVMNRCSLIERKHQEGTWIHQELKAAFIKLHQLGIAHSVEVWKESKLCGGLYGLSIGKMFCGESMFADESNMSKLALVALSEQLKAKEYKLIDCQQVTQHLLTLGAEILKAEDFFSFLENNKFNPIETKSWKNNEK